LIFRSRFLVAQFWFRLKFSALKISVLGLLGSGFRFWTFKDSFLLFWAFPFGFLSVSFSGFFSALFFFFFGLFGSCFCGFFQPLKSA